MYERITCNFKKALTGRRIDIRILALYTVFIIIFAFTMIFAAVFQDKLWHIIGFAGLFLVAACIISAYVVVFETLRQKSILRRRDFFNFRKVKSALKTIQLSDVEILIPILRNEHIDSREKVAGAIEQFRFILSKPKKNIDVIPIITLIVSILAIFLSGKTFGNLKSVLLFAIVLIYSLVAVAMLIFAFKLIYKSTYYDLSQRALCERILNVLSEIWMKESI